MFAIGGGDHDECVSDLKKRILDLENEIRGKTSRILELEAFKEEQRAKEEQSRVDRSKLEENLKRTHDAKVYFEGKVDGISEEMDMRWNRNVKRTEQTLDYLIHLLAHRFGGKPLPENIVGEDFDQNDLWPKLSELKTLVENILEKRSEQIESLACEKAALLTEIEELKYGLEERLKEELRELEESLQQVMEENKTLVFNLNLEITRSADSALKQEKRLSELEKIFKTQAREIKQLQSKLRSSEEVNYARYLEIGALNLEVKQFKEKLAQKAEEYLAAQQMIAELQACNQVGSKLAEVQQGLFYAKD